MARRENPKYLDSWLNVQKSGTGQYQRFYCLARGRELHLFENDKDARNINQVAKDKIFLSNATSVNKEDKPGVRVFPTISILFNSSSLREVRIRAMTSQQQDKWYRVLYSLCLLKLPPDMANMLPGLRMELEDMIRTEQQKFNQPQQPPDYTPCSPISPNFPPTPLRQNSASTFPPPVRPKPPHLQKKENDTLASNTNVAPPNSPKEFSWFFNDAITREDSEKILTSNSEFGNLLLRKRDPAAGNCSLGISMKLEDSQFKHYLVKEEVIGGRTQYIVQLAKQKHKPLYSLQDIVNYMESEFQGNVKALTEIRELPQGLPTHVYETVIPQRSVPPAPTRAASQSSFPFPQHCEGPYINDPQLDRPYSNIPVDSRSATLPPSSRVPPHFS